MVACAVLLAPLALMLATMPLHPSINDVTSAEVGAWRIGTAHTPWLDGVDLARLPHVDEARLWIQHTAAGHDVIGRSPGVIAAGVPAYRLWGLVHDAGPGSFSMVPGQVTAVVLVAFTLLLLWLALDGLVGLATRTLAVAVLGFTTPVWSVAAAGLYTHTVDLLGIAAMAWATRRERWWLVGLFGGIALWGRLHLALVVAILGLGLAIWRRRPRIAVTVAVPSLVLLALASWWSHALYGRWSPAGGYGTPSQYVAGAAAGDHGDQLLRYPGFLISPDRGLFVWTPALLLLLPAVVRHWRDTPDWTRLLAVAGVIYLAVQGLLDGFTGGSGFYGYRLSLETLVCAFPLLAVAAHRMSRRARLLIGPVLGLQLGAIGLGAISHGFLVRQQDVWRDNSLWLAVRHYPSVLVLLALTAAVGTLGAQVWRQRGLGTPLSAAAGAAAPTTPAGRRPG
jgi:alpha-1,2-mannosyltransferase